MVSVRSCHTSQCSPVGGAEGEGEEVQQGAHHQGSCAELNVALEDAEQPREEGGAGEEGLLVLLLLVEVKVIVHGLEGVRVTGDGDR